MPLSYIAGAITGTPGVMVRLPSGRVAPAKEALPAHALPLIELAPKEGLGLINGTAPSAAAAALVVYEAQRMAVLAQLMTAFTAECLTGNVEWSAPFIHAIRPHPGQIEAAKNIRIFLTGSKLARGFDAGAGSKSRTDTAGLCQDRYSCRTAPQWMGPYLEDLLLAQRQIEIELNSTSDNPVVEASPLAASAGEGEVYSGGNFQAVSLTSALDKARLATQMIGRMLFSQCTELINPNLSNGLDPNLVHGDPDDSYTCKGIDVNMAAYMAELAALAHPPSAHVQSAEMHNQGINSLAFLTARRTMEALDVLAHMTAAQIFVCCQAADLRDYHRRFLAAVPLAAAVDALNVSREIKTLLKAQLPGVLQECWYEANKIGHVDRCRIVASRLASHILDVLAEKNVTSLTVDAVRRFQNAIQQRMESWVKDPANDPDRSFNNRSAARVGLGQGASTLYNLARGELGVRFHLGLKDQDRQTTIGSDVSKIYEAIRDETVMDRVMSAFTREFDAVNGNADGSLFAKL
ncbi:Phenylalanine ammonia-lyase [Phytophthora megakarya]|uniref:Phenylalanine ammonia-lyase n=1 Tax=Phytophthora megakarya TaxID=4795 RepID=A0A225VP69_9STRA|nr:Phenylalanine ammonia-lyase [Phytophthora megakarya]